MGDKTPGEKTHENVKRLFKLNDNEMVDAEKANPLFEATGELSLKAIFYSTWGAMKDISPTGSLYCKDSDKRRALNKKLSNKEADSIYQGLAMDLTGLSESVNKAGRKKTKTVIENGEKTKFRKKLDEWFFISRVNSEAQDYDTWHKECCEIVLETLNEYYESQQISTGEEPEYAEDGKFKNFKANAAVKYGKAQKIVNMTMKHLYLLEWDSDCTAFFKYCHMPLDDFTLGWVHENIVLRTFWETYKSDDDMFEGAKCAPKFEYDKWGQILKANPQWSSMSSRVYKPIQRAIREYISVPEHQEELKDEIRSGIIQKKREENKAAGKEENDGVDSIQIWAEEVTPLVAEIYIWGKISEERKAKKDKKEEGEKADIEAQQPAAQEQAASE